MSPDPRTDAADWIASIGKHWIWLLAFGILTLLAGVAAVAWPGPTVIAIAVLFGIQLVVVGIFQFVSAFAGGDESGGVRVLNAVLGLFAFIIGLYAIRHVLISVVALALLLGIFWVINGFSEIFNALAHRDSPHRGWTGFMGVLSILAGIVVLAYPGISLVTLALVLGVWLIIYGVMEIAVAFRVRSAVGRVRHVVTNPV
ncbi:MAG: HdeD family acid-resistance protein [Streptosporangiaceae bacterium]